LAACDSGAIGAGQKESCCRPECPQADLPFELGSIPFGNSTCLYPAYVRGKAYLAAGQGNAAAAEFQKILDHSGIVWNCWTGAFAHLGVARANALQSRTTQGADADAARVRALAAYKDFLNALERRRPRHPHPEGNQGGVREAAMKLAQTSLLRLRSCAFHKVCWLTIFRRGETGGERPHKMKPSRIPF